MDANARKAYAEERYQERYDQCENCTAREAEHTVGLHGVEQRLCGYCAASLETVIVPLFPEDEGTLVFPSTWR
jgi:hypothetical protein